MTAILDRMLQFDYWLLLQINTVWISPGLDSFFLIFTDLHKQLNFILPLLGILLTVLIYINWRACLGLVLTLVVAVAIADLFCYRVLKKNVFRLRPQENLQMADRVRPVGDAHGSGFPSNHAANSFATAVVLSGVFRRGRHLFYILAGLVAYSRVYLAVHFPSDVLAGAMIGIIVGILCTRWLMPPFYRFILRRQVSNESAIS